jgi:hypothetical protein
MEKVNSLRDRKAEDRIVYQEGPEVRCLRGQVLEDGPPTFVRIQRRNGIVEIAKSAIIKIERGHQRV